MILQQLKKKKKVLDEKMTKVFEFGMRFWSNDLILDFIKEYDIPYGTEIFHWTIYFLLINNLKMWYEDNVILEEINIDLFDQIVPDDCDRSGESPFFDLLIEFFYQVLLSPLRACDEMYSISAARAVISDLIKKNLLSPLDSIQLEGIKKLYNIRDLISVNFTSLNIFNNDPELNNEESNLQIGNFLDLHPKGLFYNELTSFIKSLKLPFGAIEEPLDVLLLPYLGDSNKKKDKKSKTNSQKKNKKKINEDIIEEDYNIEDSIVEEKSKSEKKNDSNSMEEDDITKRDDPIIIDESEKSNEKNEGQWLKERVRSNQEFLQYQLEIDKDNIET